MNADEHSDQTHDEACAICGATPAKRWDVHSRPEGKYRNASIAIADTRFSRDATPMPADEWARLERRRLQQRARRAAKRAAATGAA